MLRVDWNIVKLVVLGCLVVFLFAFSADRQLNREISRVDISFIGDNNMYITQETVSKLLIQNPQRSQKEFKEIIDLNELEHALNSNPMIKTADVYVTVDGVLKADVVQKKPIARVRTNASYYIDDQGSYMPLSSNYSARVPLVTGSIDKNNLSNVFEVARKIQNDEFLKKHVFEIRQDKKNHIYLRLRQYDFIVEIGKPTSLDKKINNLKAFYKKAYKENRLNSYSNINLRFESQVVCTKV